MNCQRVLVEIVTKKKGCVLCELAIAILEELSEDIEGDLPVWDVLPFTSGRTVPLSLTEDNGVQQCREQGVT